MPLCTIGLSSGLDVGPPGPWLPGAPSPRPALCFRSLYNNCICDVGAESLAHVLPDMVSLRVLE